MSQPGEIQNNLIKNTMDIFNSLSFYSPLIICISIVIFSMFTMTLEKAFAFFVCILVATIIRMAVLSQLINSKYYLPEICLNGISQIFIPKDVSYSIFVLTFTMAYFIVPMILVSSQNKINMMNYRVLFFFIFYIVLDIYIKSNFGCIPKFELILANIVVGLFLGIAITATMYGSRGKPYLYINEINSNKEVCSMPSKQQFKCNVYRNGELVGNV